MGETKKFSLYDSLVICVNDYLANTPRGEPLREVVLVGQIMKETGKRADFKIARKVLEKVLK